MYFIVIEFSLMILDIANSFQSQSLTVFEVRVHLDIF